MDKHGQHKLWYPNSFSETYLYNREVCRALVEVGDCVLLANKGERGKRKLADHWENAIYVMVGKNNVSYTFKVQHASTGKEGCTVLHDNTSELSSSA